MLFDNDDPDGRQTIWHSALCVTQQVEEQMRERERAAAAAANTDTTTDEAASTVPEGLDGEKTVSMVPQMSNHRETKQTTVGWPSPRPYSLSSAAAPVVSSPVQTQGPLRRQYTLMSNSPFFLRKPHPTGASRFVFRRLWKRKRSAFQYQYHRRSCSSRNVRGTRTDISRMCHLFLPMDSSYNSKMHDLVCISMESMT
jgi:hypothetical protein